MSVAARGWRLVRHARQPPRSSSSAPGDDARHARSEEAGAPTTRATAAADTALLFRREPREELALLGRGRVLIALAVDHERRRHDRLGLPSAELCTAHRRARGDDAS